MLSSLSNEQISFLGIAAQVACACGVWFAGRWGALLAYLFLVPVFWLVPFILASGHLHFALDGIIVLPVAFLGCVCYSTSRRISAEHQQHGTTTAGGGFVAKDALRLLPTLERKK